MSSGRIGTTTFARLRELLVTLEMDLSLGSLSDVELNVLRAVRLICDDTPDQSTDVLTVRNHTLTENIGNISLGVVIQSLVEMGYLEATFSRVRVRENFKQKTFESGLIAKK